MSDPSDMVTGTIDDLLLSMAEGLVEAQKQLDGLHTVDAFGRPGPSYQLPYLDFELRISTQLTADPVLDQKFGKTLGSGSRSGGHLLINTVPATTARGMSADMLSSFKGRFVAVPPDPNRPALVLDTAVEHIDAHHYGLRAYAKNTLGEPIAGLEVHFNLDPALSAELSAADNIPIDNLRPGTSLQQGIGRTDANGVASTTLVIDAADPEPTGASIAVTVDVAGKTDVLIVIAE